MDVQAVRAQFPALQQENPPIFLDNPAGTQVSQQVIDAVSAYYIHDNANAGGFFATSQRTDALKYAARETLAAFLNAARPEEIVFGANMTTLTLHFSRALGNLFHPGDEIIVTQMDHDANITPWMLLAQDKGLNVRWVRLDPEDGTLDLQTYAAALNEKTRLVCMGHAANALGTVNPLKKMIQMAHEVGAQVYVDAVQSAPHILIDVQDLDADYLVCSAYKFYGPHVGVLYGKYNLLESLTPYKVRPAYNRNPDKWETGTGSFETIAGTQAAVNYLASQGDGDTLRGRLESAYAKITRYEQELTWQLLDGLKTIHGIEIRGIVDRKRASQRVPTVIFRLPNQHPDETAKALAKAGIYVWSGNYYAVETMRTLGHETDGGMVRIGIAHYNTSAEIKFVLENLYALC
ncbi:MAG: cysteine desulfurase-like protein [Anaerolineae bacterium]|nr:cysteine desulfurase-like protein [Anaerolineae bacterium]